VGQSSEPTAATKNTNKDIPQPPSAEIPTTHWDSDVSWGQGSTVLSAKQQGQLTKRQLLVAFF